MAWTVPLMQLWASACLHGCRLKALLRLISQPIVFMNWCAVAILAKTRPAWRLIRKHASNGCPTYLLGKLSITSAHFRIRRSAATDAANSFSLNNFSICEHEA